MTQIVLGGSGLMLEDAAHTHQGTVVAMLYMVPVISGPISSLDLLFESIEHPITAGCPPVYMALVAVIDSYSPGVWPEYVTYLPVGTPKCAARLKVPHRHPPEVVGTSISHRH